MELKIFGQIYDIKGDAESFYIKALAEYVDNKMQEVSKNTSAVSSIKIAILAALNIADDLFTMEKEYKSKMDNVDNKANVLLKIIEKESDNIS